MSHRSNSGSSKTRPNKFPPNLPAMRHTIRAIASLPTATRWIITIWPAESSRSTMMAAPCRLTSTVCPSSTKSAPCFPAPDTFAKAVILVQKRKKSMTLRSGACTGFVAEMVCHRAPSPMTELRRTPVLCLAELDPLSRAAEYSNASWAPDYSFISSRAHDNQVKEGFRRE